MNDIRKDDCRSETFGNASPGSREYVAMAAMSDLFEQEAGRLAVDAAQHSAIKDLARHMVEGHTSTAGLLLRAAMSGGGGVTIPREMDGRHRQMIEELRRKQGRDFERAYLAMEIADHEEALALHRDYAQSGDDPELQGAAQTIAGIMADHLQSVRQLADGASR
jgi:putative membrane protein